MYMQLILEESNHKFHNTNLNQIFITASQRTSFSSIQHMVIKLIRVKQILNISSWSQFLLMIGGTDML